MSYLNELWHDLFQRDITQLELEVMEGVERRVGRDEPVLILCAIATFFTVWPLYRDPNSPFVIAKNLGDAAKEIETELKRLKSYLDMNREHAMVLGMDLRSLRDITDLTEATLNRARREVKEREDFPFGAYCAMIGSGFLSGVFGVLLTLLLVKGEIAI